MSNAAVADNFSPKKIGITGGIGSGKSTACKMFACLGIPVYYADDRAKSLMETHEALVEEIKTMFGADSYTANKKLNAPNLAAQVFNNDDKLAKLNALVHPKVAQDWEAWAALQNNAYVLKEAALLFETGSYQQLDATIVVCAPKDIRVDRTILRDSHRNRQQVEDIIARQWPDSKKIKLATHQLINDDKQLLIPQILKLHQLFSAKR